MTIDEGARKLRKYCFEHKDCDLLTVTRSGSFRFWKTNYDTIRIESYHTKIAEYYFDRDILVIAYPYKGITPTTQRVIRAICNAFGMTTREWQKQYDRK